MATKISKLRIGNAQVSLLNVGELPFDLAEDLNVFEAERHGRYAQFFDQPLRVPVQCVLVQLPSTTILVDASAYDVAPESPFFIPGYSPPPDLLHQLAELGAEPQAVQHVVFTHAHFDHYNGATVVRNGQLKPAFPNAVHYLGHADWMRDELQRALRDPLSMESRTLGILSGRGLLEQVDDQREIAAEAHIIPSPGETPGHLSVRVHVDGETLYCVGDLYHHPVEVEQPTWAVTWADAAATQASRERLVEAAVREKALVIATHIGGAGHIVKGVRGVHWESA